METNSTSRMEKLFKHTKPICIGRFMLDVPAESKVVYGPAELPYAIERITNRAKDFDDLIRERKNVILTTERKLAFGDLVKQESMLGKVVDGKAPFQKIVFGVARDSGKHYLLESFQKIGNDVYVQEATTFDESFEKKLTELNMIAPLLAPRSDDQLPTTSGVCFDGAFLHDSVIPIYEYVTLGVRLNEFRDVHFSIAMTKKDRLIASDALEPRIRKAEVAARKSGHGDWYDKVKVFRRGNRLIGNWTGYEYLAWKPAIEDEAESHVFAYVSQGEPSNAMLPVLDIALDTGVRGNETSGMRPSLTDEEALYLWDKLTGSIRPRPTHPTNQ